MCILTQLHSHTDAIYSVTVVTSVYVCDRQYNGEGSFDIILVLLYSCRLVLPFVIAVYLCVCEVIVQAAFSRTDTLWRLWRQCYRRHEHGGMKTPLSFPLITWMSICVICLFLSAWSVGKGVCPYCVMVILLGWWKSSDRWCLREKLVWLEKRWCSDGPVCVCVCVCVCFFPCMSLQGCQQCGTTGSCDEGCLYGTAYSLVLRKDNPSIKIVFGALWVLVSSLYPC